MAKSAAMERRLNEFAKQMFGRERSDRQCVSCGTEDIKPTDFRDALSRKEFGISRMCQGCQDSVFGGEE